MARCRWWFYGLVPLLAVAAAAAEGNAEPMIRLPTQETAPAPSPSAEAEAEDAITRWAVPGSSGYDNYRHHQKEENLKKIREARGYSGVDICDVCPEKFPNYKAKIKNFFEEHLNTDEEIRYCLQGSGYFDARDENEQWIRVRVAVKKGGVIVLPEGMYHCFTLDSENRNETSKNPRPGVIINRPVPRRILQDICHVCPEKFPNYKAKIKNFFEEHLNTDKEIRYCLQGSGYFDARDENEQWIRVRVAVKKGGVIVLPAGMYHCFTLDSENKDETSENPRPGVIINRPVPRRILQEIAPSDAGYDNHGGTFNKKDLKLVGYVALGTASAMACLILIYRIYRFYTLEVAMRRHNIPFALYPPKGIAFAAGCVICISTFTWCARVALLPACGHAFHRRCLRHELGKASPRCPICRAAIA